MKIAFIVQEDWVSQHFGVRNFFVSMARCLECHGVSIDFCFFRQQRAALLWYRSYVSSEDFFSTEKETTSGLGYSYAELQNISTPISSVTQFLGTSIDDIYDACIVTNPWLISADLNLHKTKNILICYDIIANLFTLGNETVAPWGYAHNCGYEFAKKHGFHFLSDSEKVDKDIAEFYAPARHSFLPVCRPYAFFDVKYARDQQKENAVLLAAPFDMRKGIEEMPAILNGALNSFDRLYIFGTPRCGEAMYMEFFNNIKVKDIIYFNKITSQDLIELYKKCKVLFFPSLSEGLGLPIIEAQLCGCRVLTRNAMPMNQLLCYGSRVMKDSSAENVAILSKMLSENFDYEKLAQDADHKFSLEKVYNHIMEILH